MNALFDADVAAVGAVRTGDSKGRHTTTNRQLHLLPTGGVIIDSPGIREVGLAGDEESVDATFADVEDVATTCYFNDCTHAGEPGCAVALAVEAGDLSRDRVDAYQDLRAEAAAAARRADEHERRALRASLQQGRQEPHEEQARPQAVSRAEADAAVERRRALLPRPTYPDLPVVAHRDAILAAIRDHQVVVVAGETGSGKSTQLPKLCLELGLGVRGLIGHTQPRRLAARAISERIAEELGTEIGQAVGYTVRFNDRVGPDTFIKVMTDGILLAEIQRDRLLRAYEVLIIDEAHERSLNIDFLLGYLHQLLPERPDLKVIITSATIDTERFAAHFDGAPVVEVSGRSYPVEVRYRPVGEDEGDDRDQTQAICDAVQELMRVGPGDILVFLSGEREIRDTAEALGRLDLPGTELLPLYARLSAAEQHRVFAPHRGRRVVLATNVAETSLTVPGIIGVVDPGTARISRYNRRTKVQRLPIEAISQASAAQRAGRCGRIAPGTCIRLYSEEDFDGPPGVHRAGDPAHQPGLGHPPDGRPRPR